MNELEAIILALVSSLVIISMGYDLTRNERHSDFGKHCNE